MTTLSHAKPLFSFETIATQLDDLPAELDPLHDAIRSKVIDKTYTTAIQVNDSPEAKEILALIKNRFKMKAFFTYSEGIPAAVMPFYINRSHIFNRFSSPDELIDVDQDKMVREFKNGQKGYVDLEKAQLGGIFSEHEVYMFMDYIQLFEREKLSARECSAVLLHELGHAFYIYAYSDRLSRTNQVLANILMEVRKPDAKANKTYIYKELKTVTDKFTERDLEELIDGKSVVAGWRFALAIMEDTTIKSSVLSNHVYNQTSFEALADQFPTRFGYGRDLVTGLDKLYKATASPEKYRAWAVFQWAIWIFALYMLVTRIVDAIVVIGKAKFFYVIIAFLVIYQTITVLYQLAYHEGEAGRDYTYDELKFRYKRIRTEYVNMLKNTNLPAHVKKSVVEDIYFIDGIIKETYQYSSPLRIAMNYISPSASRAQKSVLEQQLMEELASSDLFVKSAELAAVK